MYKISFNSLNLISNQVQLTSIYSIAFCATMKNIVIFVKHTKTMKNFFTDWQKPTYGFFKLIEYIAEIVLSLISIISVYKILNNKQISGEVLECVTMATNWI